MAVHTQLQVGCKWIWKEETQSLEPISSQSSDRQARGRDRRQKGGHFQDHSKRSDRGAATPSLKSYGIGRGRQSRAVAGHRSPKQGTKQGGEHNYVTLEDVKALALEMLSEVDDVSESFEGLYGTEQFDEFLMWLLNYFHTFKEKLAHEQKPNPMNIPDPKTVKTEESEQGTEAPTKDVVVVKKKVKSEPSLAEKKYYADLCAKMEVAQKQLGQSYGVLVLGIGLDHQHHMACGQSRVSATYKDRGMYETLYSFCTFVTWITFQRKEFEAIKKEIGRILRSDTFNPAIRVKNAPDPEPVVEEGEKKEKEPEKKMTPAEYRRLHGKRPAIKSIINQRSPALVSILPQPNEAAHWLFKRTRPLSPTSLATQSEGGSEDMESAFAGMQILSVAKFKIGIIGELKSGFNLRTLTPLGADNEDEENGEEEKEGAGGRRESQLGMAYKLQDGQAGMSRQVTAVSQATTEALSDDE